MFGHLGAKGVGGAAVFGHGVSDGSEGGGHVGQCSQRMSLPFFAFLAVLGYDVGIEADEIAEQKIEGGDYGNDSASGEAVLREDVRDVVGRYHLLPPVRIIVNLG